MNIQTAMGLQGSFEITVYRPDGTVKTHIPMTKNLITDTGMLAANSLTHTTHKGTKVISNHLMNNCFVGTGTGEPAHTDTQLFSYVGSQTSIVNSSTYQEDSTHPDHTGFIKIGRKTKYMFTKLNDVNISEVGLGNLINQNGDYALYSHALVKNQAGVPTTISVVTGEILEITYELAVFLDASQKTGSYVQQTETQGQTTNQTIDYSIQISAVYPDAVGHGMFLAVSPEPQFFGGKEPSGTFNFNDFKITPTNSYNTIVYEKFNNSGRIHYSQSLNNWDKTRGNMGYVANNSLEKSEKTFHISPYDCNFEHGIRGIKLPIHSGYSVIAIYLIVLNDRETNTGLMKTDQHILEITLSASVGRKED